MDTISKWLREGQTEDYVKFINSLGSQPWTELQGEALRDFTQAQLRKWGEIIALAKIEKE